MKKIISVVNMKGGVGKTTTAVNIAACWGELGKRVLLVDIDPQGSSSASYGVMNEGHELLDALKKREALPVVPTGVNEVDLVPSGPELVTADQIFMGTDNNELLSDCIKQTSGDWDLIIIDCPPSLGVLTMNALLASKHVLIPVEASFLGLRGLKQMVAAIETLKSRNPEINIEAIIPCRAQRRRRIHWDIMGNLEEMFPAKVTPIIRENVSLAEAPGRGKPVILTARLSKGADDYRIVTMWLSDRIGEPKQNEHVFSRNLMAHFS
jgi:chromosome partitioning protein